MPPFVHHVIEASVEQDSCYKWGMISVGGQWTTSDDSYCVKSKPWKSGRWRSEAPGLWAPKFLQTSWRERSTMHVRKPLNMEGNQTKICCCCSMNVCSVCVVWIFGSKEGASGLTLDQASVMCCRPSPCNVEYYTSIDNIQSTWTGYREYIQHRSGTRLKFWIFNAGIVSYQSTTFGIFLVEIIFWG